MTEEAAAAPAGNTPPGWYPNPSGAPGSRYFDGSTWTAFHHATVPATPAAPPLPTPSQMPTPYPIAYPQAYPGQPPTTVVVTGPNHALHAVLTLLTFWACGGWAWIWLIVAISNRRQVHVVSPPPPPYR